MDPAFAALVLSSVRQALGAASEEAGRSAWQGLVDLVRRARGRPDVDIDPAQPEALAHVLTQAAGRDPGFAADLRRWAEVHDVTLSHLSGAARDVVQARDITGGVHFHAGVPVMEPAVVPRQLPAAARGFVGRAGELRELAAVAGGPECGLVLVTGTAGAGKSALVVGFAHQVACPAR